MKYNRFEDTPVWQEARLFTSTIYKTINQNNKLSRDYSICDQLKRASSSIMLNIAEGFERGSTKDFANFLSIAKGSAGEVRSILYIILDNNYITKNEFELLCSKICDISCHIANFRKYLIENPRKR